MIFFFYDGQMCVLCNMVELDKQIACQQMIITPIMSIVKIVYLFANVLNTEKMKENIVYP